MCKDMNLTKGLVIGSRKAGTTWLYENFKKDDRISVSHKVKESGFFSGRMGDDTFGYENLWVESDTGYRVEVDTSICSSDEAVSRIYQYNREMKLVLILRSPAEFLVSRFTHGLRKGEFNSENIFKAYDETPMFRRELDYPAIVAQYKKFTDQGNLEIFKYSELTTNPVDFYANVVEALGVESRSIYEPFSNHVNVARNSKHPKISQVFSDAAVIARKYGLHRLVNAAKKIGFHSALEQKRNGNESDQLLIDAEKLIHRSLPETLRFYDSLE